MDDSFWSSGEAGNRLGLPPKSIYYDPVDFTTKGATGGSARGIAVDDAFCVTANTSKTVGIVGRRPEFLADGADGDKRGGRVEIAAGLTYIVFMTGYVIMSLLSKSTSLSFSTIIDGKRLLITSGITTLCSILSLLVLTMAVRPIMYGLCVATPLTLLSVSALAFKQFTTTGHWYMCVVSLASLVVALWILSRLSRRNARENVDSVAQIFAAAKESLLQARYIFLVPSVLAVAFSSLVITSMSSSRVHVLIKAVAVLWTLGVCESMMKFVTASAFHDYYYGDSPSSSSNAILILVQAITSIKSFGTVCLMGMIALVFRVLTIVSLSYKFIVNQTINIPIMKTILLSMSSWITIVERWSLKFSDHCMYVSMATGQPLWPSCRLTVTLFRRNLITLLLTDSTVTMFTFSMTTVILLVICMSFGGNHGTTLITMTITYVIIKLHMDIMTACMDCSLVCYAMDVDGNEMRQPKLHQAFSNRMAVVRDDNTR